MSDGNPDLAIEQIAKSFSDNLKAMRNESIEFDEQVRRGRKPVIENEAIGFAEQVDGSEERQESH